MSATHHDNLTLSTAANHLFHEIYIQQVTLERDEDN